ncbi:hypothetical protein [Halalkalibacter alkalisediminis]|uniref:DUF4321 domain-containing protein n=1 Tax=Halalkalibacter alkalisediminis TaxID=935616 RepID=A0ABV6NJ59_9BACI|nr:hypothetical protein [Halalkalibacter alkalisediminis]
MFKKILFIVLAGLAVTFIGFSIYLKQVVQGPITELTIYLIPLPISVKAGVDTLLGFSTFYMYAGIALAVVVVIIFVFTNLSRIKPYVEK